MKYNIRFFVNKNQWSTKHTDIQCIANTTGTHIPKKNDFIYLSDESLDKSIEQYSGVIFQVLYVVKIFDNDGLTTVEVVLKETRL